MKSKILKSPKLLLECRWFKCAFRKGVAVKAEPEVKKSQELSELDFYWHWL